MKYFLIHVSRVLSINKAIKVNNMSSTLAEKASVEVSVKRAEDLENLTIEEENRLLKAELISLKKQGEKSRRDLAMEWIRAMDNLQFESRLLSSFDHFKLPDFQRAEEGDEDYPNLSLPQRDIAVPHYRWPLTYEDTEGGFSNFACVKREYLRYMSEEEFIKISYEETKLTYEEELGLTACDFTTKG